MAMAAMARRYAEASALGLSLTLEGPVGERNLYSLHPRGLILMKSATREGLLEQMAAVLATGNHGVVDRDLPEGLPTSVAACFSRRADGPYAAALVEGDADAVAETLAQVARLPGPIVPVHAARQGRQLHAARQGLPLAYHAEWLLEEVSISINTTAAGGNAALMMIG